MRAGKISAGLAGILFLCCTAAFCAAADESLPPGDEFIEIQERVTNASSKKALKRQEKEAKRQAEKAKKEAEAALKKEEKTKQKETEKSKKINIAELVSNEGIFQSKTVENQVGDIRLLLKGNVGSFQIYTVNKEAMSQPLLAGYDEFTSSFFSLRAGKKEYKLSNNIGIVIGTRKTDVGAQMVYVVPKLARVLVRFECIKSGENGNADILKVNAVVRNRSKRTEVFALKNVLDTFLGEQKGPHFSTADDIAVNSEMQYRKFDRMKWICSANSKASMQILLHGADITPPEVVSLGNKDLLALPSWIPQVVRSRTFDSVLSYNNSAVCINWEEKRLAPEEEFSCTYYIAMASDGETPAGEEFIAALEKRLKAEQSSSAEKENAVKDSITFIDTDSISLSQQDFGAYASEKIVSDVPEVVSGQTEATACSGEFVPFDIETIGAEKLNYQYIQSLIDRINSLEGDDQNLDRNELLRLNAELDAILEKLRQM